jgi:integrase
MVVPGMMRVIMSDPSLPSTVAPAGAAVRDGRATGSRPLVRMAANDGSRPPPEHVMHKRLGHADARTTREVYTHVPPDSERKAAGVMEAMLRHDVA